MVCPQERCPAPIESDSTFQQCRKIFDQLGLASFEKRQAIHTLRKNEKLLREVKNLDNQVSSFFQFFNFAVYKRVNFLLILIPYNRYFKVIYVYHIFL